MKATDYRTFEDLTVDAIEWLQQAYNRCLAEGYEPGFDFDDFLNIVMGRGEHKVTEHEEQRIEENS